MRSQLIVSAALALLLSVPAFAATTQFGGVATGAKVAKGETVEQRITNLHIKLQITSDEEQKWGTVAQAMRDNAANMQKLASDTQTAEAKTAPTAKDILANYQKFAQAHVDGLKNLNDAFDALYDSMPAPQQKIADGVFASAPQPKAPASGQ